MSRRLLFYVQHLLGIGHLVRAMRIAGELAAGFEVTLVVGGDLPPGLAPATVDIVRLPAVKGGEGGFGALVHPDGRLFGASDQAARRDALLACFDRRQPDVLLIEAFPFGRRQMRFELLPLLERACGAARRPLIVCSIRDILQARRPERDLETVDLVRRYFDLVLVHGDPAWFPLSDSFPAAAAIDERLRYTGMVGPGAAAATPEAEETFDVIVSVGGGAVGADLVEAAIAAKPRSALAGARWLVLTGPNLERRPPDPADETLIVRRFDPALPRLLGRARVSVSQAGYNTVADLAAAGCRPVLVPFGRGGETEQVRRADVLERRGWAVTLEEARLTPDALAAAIGRTLHLPAHRIILALDGAARTRAVLDHELARRGVARVPPRPDGT